MSKHTPGPWKVESDLRGEDEELVGWDVISDHGPIVGCEGIEAWFPNALADARLIAAAPCMLAALEYARNLIGRDEILDAAIAKAKGEA